MCSIKQNYFTVAFRNTNASHLEGKLLKSDLRHSGDFANLFDNFWVKNLPVLPGANVAAMFQFHSTHKMTSTLKNTQRLLRVRMKA